MTYRGKITHIPTKLYKFLINSFSVTAWTHVHTQTDESESNTLLHRFANAHGKNLHPLITRI